MSAAVPSLRADRIVKGCGLICLIGFGGFMAWAGFAPLAEGVVASGVVVVENNRRVVQHLEGGIIETIHVREGAIVEAGDPLIVLGGRASKATRAELVFEAASLQASILRRDAQSKRQDHVSFDGLDRFALALDDLSQIVAREDELFRQESRALKADLEVLLARQQGAVQSSQIIREQIKSTQQAIDVAAQQLASKQESLAQQLARLEEVRDLERSLAGLRADSFRLENEAARANSEARDFAGQIAQTEARYDERLAGERVEARKALQTIEERLGAAQDVVDRAVILAPQSGEVINLRFHTVGGVVAPGEAILEIVPTGENVIASVRIRPTDRASVAEGLDVRTRISAFNNRDVEELTGKVIDISGDLKTDPATQAVYYEALVRIDMAQLNPELVGIIPGLPVDVFIFSGAERTTLDYIMSPLSDSLFAGLRSK